MLISEGINLFKIMQQKNSQQTAKSMFCVEQRNSGSTSARDVRGQLHTPPALTTVKQDLQALDALDKRKITCPSH